MTWTFRTERNLQFMKANASFCRWKKKLRPKDAADLPKDTEQAREVEPRLVRCSSSLVLILVLGFKNGGHDTI